MSVTDEIKDRIDIVDLVTESVELRRAGRNFSGFCPFHHNVNTPSFVVFPDTQTWKCFGECDEGGDVFSFVMKREGWEFAEALRSLAERAGVVLKPLTPQAREKQEESDRLRSLLEAAVEFFRHQLLEAPAGRTALDYLKNRDLSPDTWADFGLGYAPDSWDAGLAHFQRLGYSNQDLLNAGLATEKEGGGIYDRFRHRLMIPIRDRSGRMAGFGARALDPDGMPKYLNSPQTALFDKSRLLFGLDLARKQIRDQDLAVIVEGYMGVLGPYQHGFRNIVAQMGTALNEGQLRVLKKYSSRFIIAMDSDAAGQKATLRGLEIARQTMDRSPDPIFDARGLLHHEGRLQADIRVLTLPAGQDPDDVTQQDPQKWQELLDQAQPVVMHVMNTLAADLDLADPKNKSAVATRVLPLIDDISDSIERDVYLQRLSRLLEVSESVLLSYRPERKRPRTRVRIQEQSSRSSIQPPGTPGPRNGEAYERHCVGILLREPELIYQVDRALSQDGLERFDAKDFQNTDFQILIACIRDALNQTEEKPIDYIINHLPEDVLELVDELLNQTQNLKPRLDEVRDDFLRAFLYLRKLQIKKQNDHYRFLQETSHENGDYIASEYQNFIYNNIKIEHKIDIALKRVTSRTAALDS